MSRRVMSLGFELRKVNKDVHRPNLEHGWMLPYIFTLDNELWGRWRYLEEILTTGALPERPIPQIQYDSVPHAQTLKMLEQCLDAIPNYAGSWRGWSSSTFFEYFLDWLLYAVGYRGQKTLPREPSSCEGASDRLYQLFQAGALQMWPYDYLGYLMCETGFGKHAGFFPTPLSISTMMAKMICTSDGDFRAETMNDPCCGSGRLMMAASNYCLRLTGTDILSVCVKATIVNLAFYAPWGLKPVPFLDEALRSLRPRGELAEQMIRLAELGEWQSIGVVGSSLGVDVAHVMDESCALSVFEPSGSAETSPKSGIHVHQSDLTSTAATFDRILGTHSLWGDYGIDAARQSFENLKPGGILVCLVHRNAWLSEHPKYEAFDNWLKTCCARFEIAAGETSHPLYALKLVKS